MLACGNDYSSSAQEELLFSDSLNESSSSTEASSSSRIYAGCEVPPLLESGWPNFSDEISALSEFFSYGSDVGCDSYRNGTDGICGEFPIQGEFGKFGQSSVARWHVQSGLI